MRIQSSKFKIQNIVSTKFIWILLLGIIILASVLRFYQLGKTPSGLDWDEVSLGYNAYSILHTGKDEYGVMLPFVLKSFGDYKPALYAYIDIPSVALFGLTPLAVRFPSAFLGVVTVLLTFFFVEELFKRRDIALVSSFLLAISPWHMQFSRVAFETNVGIFFNVLGSLLFLKGLKKPWLLTFSVLSFVLSVYVYQSEKVFTPLLFILLIVIFRKEILSIHKKYIISAIIIGTLAILPIFSYTFFNTNGLARAQGVSIFSATKLNQEITRRYEYNRATNNRVGLVLDNKRFVYTKQIFGNYLSHFDFNWLFITGDISRHHAPDMGLLYIWELPFIFIGIYQLLFGRYGIKTKLLIFGWFLLAPVPASITQDVPHAVRTMNFLPIYAVFTALGMLYIFEFLRNKKWILLCSIGVLLIVGLFNFAYYLDQYFVQQNYFTALDWQYGYDQIVASTNELGKPYSHIVVDTKDQFSQSYIFYLFYGKIDPKQYQHFGNQNPSQMHTIGKYTFRSIDWNTDKHMTNTLFVGNASDFPADVSNLKKIIYTVDGKPLAAIVGSK